jgi:hypothetical protein
MGSDENGENSVERSARGPLAKARVTAAAWSLPVDVGQGRFRVV